MLRFDSVNNNSVRAIAMLNFYFFFKRVNTPNPRVNYGLDTRLELLLPVSTFFAFYVPKDMNIHRTTLKLRNSPKEICKTWSCSMKTYPKLCIYTSKRPFHIYVFILLEGYFYSYVFVCLMSNNIMKTNNPCRLNETLERV